MHCVRIMQLCAACASRAHNYRPRLPCASCAFSAHRRRRRWIRALFVYIPHTRLRLPAISGFRNCSGGAAWRSGANRQFHLRRSTLIRAAGARGLPLPAVCSSQFQFLRISDHFININLIMFFFYSTIVLIKIFFNVFITGRVQK